jgi:cysteinyl-tRNA synthetase
MRIFNTMTQRKEEFVPREEGRVTLYVCGVTPYDTAHLGHAFVYATFDTLVRVLRARGLQVTYTQNITDIDDPLFARASELHISWEELARNETDRFVREMKAIDVAPPTYFVRASDELSTMLEIIQQLLDRDFAYQSDGWIYFDTTRDPTFGQLAAAAGLHDYGTLLATANDRGNDPADPRKRDPLDFVLWRAALPDEPSWPSPFGPGRPGWHIECSAMSTRYLGAQIDIHGGGTDLIFPHHSSEIAQSENVSDLRPFVRYWMHVGMVGLNGVKMSKSLGNLVIVHELLADHSPDAVRALLAGHHYRSEWSYTDSDMAQAQQRAERLTVAAAGSLREAPPAADSFAARAAADFHAMIDDDLDIPAALGVLDALAAQIVSGDLPVDEVPVARGQLVTLAGLLGLRLGRE